MFDATPSLNSFFKVLSLSLDRKKVPYISTLEAQKVVQPALLACCPLSILSPCLKERALTP
jgi:hypothetical protein